MSEETASGVKRARESDVRDNNDATPDTAMDDSEDDEDVGPMPMPDAGAAPRKKRKGSSHVHLHFQPTENSPVANCCSAQA